MKIAEGCNRTCSFCVIPQLRGKQRSRTADDVVAEVEQLVAGGVVELNLVSQDTVAYGRDLAARAAGHAGAAGRALAELVRRVADVKGVRWVRLFYLYPETIDDALIELLAQHPRVVPYVDMPLQHAADAMLKRMRRGHGKDRQKRVVERLRDEVPGLTFRTAFIVGHPGETEADFEELCDFVDVGALRARRRLPLLGRGDARRARHGGQGPRARRRQPRRASSWRSSAASRARRTARSSAASSRSSSKGRARSTSS